VYSGSAKPVPQRALQQVLAGVRAQHDLPKGPLRVFGITDGGIGALELAAHHPS